MKVYKGLSGVLACFFLPFFSATVSYSDPILPSASFVAGPASGTGGAPIAVQFTDTSTANPTSYLWQFGDGQTSTELHPIHAYYEPGTYTVTHTVANGTGEDIVTEDYIVSACANPSSVMLANDGSFHNTIMEAYAAASSSGSNNRIMLMAGAPSLEEDLHFDGNASIELKGGYDCSFGNNTMFTKIPGSLTIASGAPGTITLSNIVITSALPQCAANDPTNFPGNPEICDGKDNNCNGLVDDGLTIDADGDGYTAIGSCTGSADDCNDHNAGIHPGASEPYPADGIDQDCDGNDLVIPYEQECLLCHELVDIKAMHRTAVTAPDATCVHCHAAPVTSLETGHYGEAVRIAGNNMIAGSIIGCTSCHDWHDTRNYDTGIHTNFVWAKVTAARPRLTCDTCHEQRAALHATETAHNNRIITSLCTQCHSSDTSVLGSPGTGTLVSAADVDRLHRSDCTLCHNYTGSKLNAALVKQAIKDGLAGTQISCTTCHGTNFPTTHAFLSGHYNLVRVGTTICGNCHHDAPPLVDATDPKVHKACTNCHDANFNTISLAAGKSFAAGGDCTTCHGSQSHHKNSEVSYNAAVDTSQTSQQGCATCHHDYDSVNGTSVGLSTWAAILTEHDLDGVKDGSTNTCEGCHAYDGSKSAPLAAVRNAIASGTPATCATCHTDKVPNVSHGIPTNGKHTAHLALPGVGCATCHGAGPIPRMADGGTLSTTTVCGNCHRNGAGGGPNNNDYKTGWNTLGYNVSCSGCHDFPPAYANSSAKANNHGKHPFSCGSCHAATSADGVTITGPSAHANGVFDVVAGNGVSFTYTAAPTGGSCSAVSCHGGSTATWSWSAVANHAAALGSGDIYMAIDYNNSDHPPGFSITEECALCHYASLPAQHTNQCALCHGAGSGPPAGLPGAWNQSCQACHPTLHAGMGVDHNGIYWNSSASCSLCHDDSGEFPGPGDNCARCHTPGLTAASVGDHQAPTTTTDVVGLFIGPATIHLTATDAGTSGVSLTRFSLDGKMWKLGNIVYASAPTTGSRVHTLQFYSTDHAMNIEAVHTINFTVKAP